MSSTKAISRLRGRKKKNEKRLERTGLLYTVYCTKQCPLVRLSLSPPPSSPRISLSSVQ